MLLHRVSATFVQTTSICLFRRTATSRTSF
jgi:hypothetical protein